MVYNAPAAESLVVRTILNHEMRCDCFLNDNELYLQMSVMKFKAITSVQLTAETGFTKMEAIYLLITMTII